MRKLFTLLAVLFVFVSSTTFAQLTGTKNIPGDYPTLLDAINDLNTQGVGAGGVILNLIAGNPQTAPLGGYTITTLTGTAANTIVIQGNSNIITAPTPQTTGNLNDAIFKILGADYVTITGFTMMENASNTTTTAASNNMTEWGVALLYASTTNGCQNITISNNTIDLNRTYQNTFGIYANSTHSATAVTTSATATTTAGANNNLTITGNSITDVNIGIVVVGPTAAADHNDALTIGGSVLNANSITNYGTTGTFSAYANVSGTVNGILVRNTKNFTVSYNSVTSSNGGTTAGTLRGIYIVGASNAPTGTLTQTVNNNSISIRSGVASGSMVGIFTEASSGNSTTTLSVSNNDFNTITHTIAASGTITLISNTSSVLTTNINNNTFTNISCNTTGSFTFISNSVTRPANAVCTVSGNSIVTAFSKTGAGGTVQFYNSNSTSPTSVSETNSNNNFSNITVTGATTIAGWQSTDGSTTTPFGPNKTVTNNTFNNITGGTNTVTLLNVAYSNAGSSTNNVSGNTVSNVTSAGTINGISSATATQNFFNNTIHSLSTTGASTVTGMNISGGAVQNIYKNKIYNLQSNNASGFVNGITVSSGTTITIYNNLIGDLKTPSSNAANPLVGLNITGGTTVNAYFNTVYLNATSSGALFGSSAVSVSTTPTVTLKDNIFVNLSTPNGAAYTVAYRRSTTTLTTYGSNSNYNLFYAGTPGANNLIFTDGTNFLQTLSNYKSLSGLSPRDANSVTENPPFLSTSGSSSSFLHINTAIATSIESGGNPVSGITEDFDGDLRNASTPDIGADEGNFTFLDVIGPTISYTPLTNTTVVSSRSFTSITITDVSGVNTSGGTMPRCFYKKSTDANSYAGNTSGDDGWKWVEANGTSSPFDFTLDFSIINGGSINTGDVIQYFVTAQDLASTPNVGINQGTFASTPANVSDYANMFPLGGTIRTFLVVDAPMSGTYTVGLSMMRPLTGKNLEFVPKTRRVKKLVPIENTDTKENITTEKKEDFKEINHATTISSFKDNTKQEMTEVEIEETYYELQENGNNYKGPLYAEYPQKTGDNKNPGAGTTDFVGNYATITAALTDLNNRGVNGAVTFLLIDNGTYAGETYPLQFNSNISGISSSNTVTLKPQSGVSSIIPGNIASNATFRILSNYVTIDGSNSGGTDRSLTIQNNNTTTPNVVLIGSTGTTPVTNVTLKNCIIINGANTSSAVVVSDGTTIGSAGYFNTISIQNNLIEKAYIGVYATGGTSSVNGFNLSVSDNQLTTIGINSIRLVGLYAQYTNGVIFSNNLVSNIANTSDASFTGAIWAAAGTSNVTISNNLINAITSTTATSSYYLFGILLSNGVASSNCNISNNFINTVSCTNSATSLGIGFYGATDGVTIERNYITNIKNSNSTGWGAAGIWAGGTTTTGTNTVKNNMVSDVAAYGYASGTSLTDNGYGIIVNGGAGHKIYNNSVNMNTNQTLTTGLPSAINITSGVTTVNGLDIRNNAFINTMTAGTQRYAIYSGAANTVYSSIDYNCYYSPTNLGNLGATDRTTMANWRTATGKDVLSFNSLPVFVTAINLHIAPSDLTVSGRGTYIAIVTTDIDGNPRPTSQSTSSRPVDVGCDQYTPSGYSGNLTTYSAPFYYDGNLKAVEVVSGSMTVTSIKQFPGVQTPNNSLMKKSNGIETPTKNIKKQGEKGGQSDRSAVNTPWVYWQVSDLNTPSGITLRFYYNDEQLATIPESNLRLSYWDGSYWYNGFTQSVDLVNNYIQIDLPAGFIGVGNTLFAIEDVSFPLPVVLSEFNITAEKRDANLKWITTQEINNKGFAIERRIKINREEYTQWKEIAFVDGNGTTNQPVTYIYSDKKLNSAVYQYRLRQVDFNGHSEYYTPGQSDIAIGKPGTFELGQNYPNPSNPKSKIDFQMPFDGKVTIKVYDILGQEVKTLVDEFKSADFYTIEFDGSNLASGTYFYRVIAEGNGQKFTKTLKMILVK